MKRVGFTMVELVVTIVIMGILASGAYIALKKLYTKTAKSKAISELSFDSTIIANQISSLLINRVPSTVIGYDSNSGNFESIYNLSSNYEILEWISVDFESFRDKKFSGFVDLERSDKTTSSLYSPDTNISQFDTNKIGLIFSGSFDEGSIYGLNFNNSFGWHGNSANEIFDISSTSSDENITLSVHPNKIYEKYYLVDSAYAIAKSSDINTSASCIQDLNISISDNILFLFYDYRPWKLETFCADPNGTTQEGNVTVLSNETSGFEVDFVEGMLQFKLTLSRSIPKGGNKSVTISKQKAIF